MHEIKFVLNEIYDEDQDVAVEELRKYYFFRDAYLVLGFCVMLIKLCEVFDDLLQNAINRSDEAANQKTYQLYPISRLDFVLYAKFLLVQ